MRAYNNQHTLSLEAHDGDVMAGNVQEKCSKWRECFELGHLEEKEQKPESRDDELEARPAALCAYKGISMCMKAWRNDLEPKRGKKAPIQVQMVASWVQLVCLRQLTHDGYFIGGALHSDM